MYAFQNEDEGITFGLNDIILNYHLKIDNYICPFIIQVYNVSITQPQFILPMAIFI